MKKLGLSLLLLIWLSGCSTIGTKTGEDSEWGKPYSGLKTSPQNSYHLLNRNDDHILVYIIIYIGAIIDFVASTAADTVLLPADAYMMVAGDGGNEGEDENTTEDDSEASE